MTEREELEMLRQMAVKPVPKLAKKKEPALEVPGMEPFNENDPYFKLLCEQYPEDDKAYLLKCAQAKYALTLAASRGEYKRARLQRMRDAALKIRLEELRRRPTVFELFTLNRFLSTDELEGRPVGLPIRMYRRNVFWPNAKPQTELLLLSVTVFSNLIVLRSKDDIEYPDVQEYIGKKIPSWTDETGFHTLAKLVTGMEAARQWAQAVADSVCDHEWVAGIVMRKRVSRIKELRTACRTNKLHSQATGYNSNWS